MIRKIRLEDLDSVYSLLNELYNSKIDYDIFQKKYVEYLKGTETYGITIEIDNKIIGVLISRIINRLVKDRKTLFIDELIIDESYRRKGYGKKLLSRAIDFAKDNSYGAVELTSHIENIGAHKLYQEVGFEKQHYKFKMKL